MRVLCTMLTVVCVSVATATAADAPLTFTAKPSVTRAGDGLKVQFAVSAPTDVEVAVLDASGRVVRHLAAGVIGRSTPPPEPLKPGLVQELAWDGKNDAGEPANGATVRVRAGTSARLKRLIGGSPYIGQATDQHYRGSLPGIAIDARGHVYVKMMSDVHSHGNSGLWPWQLREFDAEGNYLKTLLPYPPSTDPARAPGMALLDTGDGAFTPANQSSLYPVFYNFGSVICPYVRPDSAVVFVNSRAREMHFFKTDGSNQLRTVKMWPGPEKIKSPDWLEAEVAFSPDGRFAYIAGLAGTVYDGKKPEDVDPKWPNGRVYRLDLTQEGASPAPFFDIPLPDYNQTKYWMPSAWDHRCASGGIDVDPQGAVYIGDLVNQQIHVVGPDGRATDALKAPWPDRIRVHPKTGDLYVGVRVVSRGGRPPCRLIKITGRGTEAKIVADLTMRKEGNMEFTLDARGERPVLWVLAKGDNPIGQALLRVEDRGSELAVVKDVFNRDPDAIGFVGNLEVDRERDVVYVTNTSNTTWRYDGKTGQGGRFKVGASDLAIHGDRLLRIISWNSGLAWFTLAGEPDPSRGLKAPGRSVDRAPGVVEFGSYYGRAGRGCSVGGLVVDRTGRIWTLVEGSIGENQTMFVKAYHPDGTPVQFDRTVQQRNETIPVAISGFDNRAGCIRVDRAGNLYVGWGRVLKGHRPPAGYEKDEAYRVANGVVLKFGPKGGHKASPAFTQKDADSPTLGFENVERIYGDLAPFSAWRCDGSCICCKPRFDVDDFGRLYIPNALTFSVAIVDNAGNPITRFGQYGNFDAKGPQSAEPKPAVPLGWPTGIGVSGDHLYVGDVLNHRVVQVELTHTLSETCAVAK
jgi:hypothetical protein